MGGTEIGSELIPTGTMDFSSYLLWWYDLPYEETKRFAAAFAKKYGKPAENQAWGDYYSTKAIALAMQQAGTTDSKKVVEAMEKIKFDGGKGRPLYFRAWDHQLMQPMWVAVGKKKSEAKDQWDIWKIAGEVPDKNEDLEVIASTKEENACEMQRS